MKETIPQEMVSPQPLGLFSRLFSYLFDQVLILLLFVVLSILLFGIYIAPGELGTYSALIELRPDIYEFMPKESLNIDIRYTTLFVATNMIYYELGFVLCKTSFCKRIFNGIYIGSDEEILTISKGLTRCSVLALTMVGMIAVRFIFGLTYWHVIIAFSVINTLFVMLTKEHTSLIDFASNTFLVDKSTTVLNNSEKQ